jgi:rhodanese-related sulfurtransferase
MNLRLYGASRAGAGGLLVFVSLLLAACTGPRRVSDKDIEVVAIGQVLRLVESQQREPDERKLLLIDARSAQAFEAGHLPGAENIRLPEIDPERKRDKRLDSYDEIVVYADNPGSASARALVKRMLRIRYDDVRLFPGGYDQWVKAGLDVETAP